MPGCHNLSSLSEEALTKCERWQSISSTTLIEQDSTQTDLIRIFHLPSIEAWNGLSEDDKCRIGAGSEDVRRLGL